MKKKLVLAVMLVCMLAVCACGKDKDGDSETEESVSELTEGIEETNIAEESCTVSDADTEIEDDEEELYASAIKDIKVGKVTSDNYVPNGVTPSKLVDVLLGTGKFVNTDDQNKEIYLSELMREDVLFQPYGFHVVDLDLDGYNELIVDGSPESTEIFHYEDGVVYGFWFNYRGTANVTDTGIFMGSSGASSGQYYRVDFHRDTYTETELGVFDYQFEQSSELFGVSVDTFLFDNWFLTGSVPHYWDFEDIKTLVNRETSAALEAEEYIKNQELSQAIVDVLLHNAEFTDTSGGYVKTTLSEFSKWGEEFKVQKYTIADVDADGQNDLIAYFGEKIPLVTVFTNDTDWNTEEKGVAAHTTFASNICVINPDGVCYGNGDSYHYNAYNGHILREKTVCEIYEKEQDGRTRTVYEVGYDEVSAKEYYEYFKDLWKETIPFCRDLSILEK